MVDDCPELNPRANFIVIWGTDLEYGWSCLAIATFKLAFTASIFEIERENGSVVNPTDPERNILTGT